jgi:NitT/TauT family transport system permease protein
MSTPDYTIDQAAAVGRPRFVDYLVRFFKSRRLWRTVLSLAGAFAFLALWDYASGNVWAVYILPSPIDVFNQMKELVQDGTVWNAFWATLRKTLYGWGAAFVIGVPIGLLMGRYRYANAFFQDFVYILANVPLLVYAVISLVIFGVSDTGPAFVVLLLVLPAVAINTAAGVKSADEGLLSMSRSFNRSPVAVTKNVIFPAVTPFLLAAGRVSFADSWKLAALTETFGGSSGIGFELNTSFELYSVVDALAWMFFFVIFVILIERILLLPAERRIFSWRNPGEKLV